MAKSIRIVVFALIGYFVLSAGECKKVTEQDSAPYINSRQPSGYTLNKKIGDTVNFSATATDADDDPIDYKTLKDGTKVNDTNSYEFLIDEIGTFVIQIIAYNAEADTAEWQVNVENQAPVIGSVFNKTEREDEVDIGSIVDVVSLSDNEDAVENLTLELTQTNSDLIQFGLDADRNIIIENYLENGNGSADVTLRATDSHGAVSEETFTYNITPMTDIEGRILDSDTWEPSTALLGFAIIEGDTVWADATGMYITQIGPISSIDIEAGYRSLDKTQPMSFITTARSVNANNDMTEIDIMVVTYLNNNLTPEEFRILAWETNFGPGNYTGAKVSSTSMVDKLITSGNPAISWDGSTYLEEMTPKEIADIKRVIADSINAYLRHPFPLEEVIYYDGILDEMNVVTWEKQRWDNTTVSRRDYNNDGIIDNSNITTRGFDEGYYNSFISGLMEEGYASRGEYYGVFDASLKDRSIAAEFSGVVWVHECDIKFIKFIEGVAHEVGYLYPKMPIDDVLKIQE